MGEKCGRRKMCQSEQDDLVGIGGNRAPTRVVPMTTVFFIRADFFKSW